MQSKRIEISKNFWTIILFFRFVLSYFCLTLDPGTFCGCCLKFTQFLDKFSQIESCPSLRTFKPRNWNIHCLQLFDMRSLFPHFFWHVELIDVVVAKRYFGRFFVFNYPWRRWQERNIHFFMMIYQWLMLILFFVDENIPLPIIRSWTRNLH